MTGATPLAWSALSYGWRAAAALATFTIIARSYGASAFGAYAGTLGFVALFTGFASLGSVELAARETTRTGERTTDGSEALSRILSRFAIAGPVVLTLVTVTGTALFSSLGSPSQRAVIILMLAVGEFAHSGLVEAVNALLVALDDHRAAAGVSVVGATVRLLAVAWVAGVGTGELRHLAYVLAGSGVVAALIAVGVAWERGLRPTLSTGWFDSFGAGVDLALGSTARKTVHDVDQAVLLRNGLVVDTGLYSIAARMTQYAYLPALVVLQVTYPRYFEHGRAGVHGSWRYAHRVGPPLLGYGLVAAVLLGASTALIVPVFGEDFSGAEEILLWLCFIPLLRIAHSILGDVLISSGHVADRTRPVVAAAGLNLAATLALVPALSWRGAVVATYLTETFILVVFAVLVRRRLRSTTERAAHNEGVPDHV